MSGRTPLKGPVMVPRCQLFDIKLEPGRLPISAGPSPHEKPDGNISLLMCVAVNEAADGKELPDPGQDYLEAVKDKEDGKSATFGHV